MAPAVVAVTGTRASPRWVAAACGGLAALYLLSGRWAMSRMSGDLSDPPFHLELRLWIVLLLVASAWLAQPIGGLRRLVLPLLAAFLGWAALTAVWAPDPSLAARKAYEVVLVGAASLALGRILSSGDAGRTLRWMWVSMIALAGTLALIALANLLRSGAGGERLSVLAGGPNVFARMMGFLALGALFFWRRTGSGWLFAPVVAVSLLLVLLSGSRGGLLSTLAALAVFAALELRSARRLLPGIAVAAVVLALAVSFTPLGRAALDSYEERVDKLLLQERYTAGRSDLYRAAWDLGLTAPVFGPGLAAFPGRRLGVYPHNLFLETFCETGLLGLWLLGLTLAAGLAFAFRRRRPDGAAIAGFVLVLVSSQFSGDLYDSRGLFAFLVAASVRPLVEDEDRRGAALPAPGGAPGKGRARTAAARALRPFTRRSRASR